jgi:hypothetical protein
VITRIVDGQDIARDVSGQAFANTLDVTWELAPSLATVYRVDARVVQWVNGTLTNVSDWQTTLDFKSGMTVKDLRLTGGSTYNVWYVHSVWYVCRVPC